MEKQRSFWVIGHKILPVATSGAFDMVVGETPVGVPGPPPHHHTRYSEMFLVLKGKMEMMVNGERHILQEGECIDLPPNTLHTFSNAGTEPMRWLNIHSPKGFLAFFNAFAVEDGLGNSFEESVSQAMIEKVSRNAASYDMHIAHVPTT
jgi:mannose-6-phosphate isomerase-like protein (cupin superfamily)